MQKRLGYIVFAITSALLAGGCINMSALQTAEALKKGSGRVILGAGYYTSPSLNEALKDDSDGSTTTVTTDEIEDIKVPYGEIGYRYGLFDRLEVGGKLTLIGTTGVDAKYQFLDAGGFDMAAGLGIGYMTLESSSGSGDSEHKYENTMIDATVPLYISYRVGNPFAFYLVPKYVLRSISTKETLGSATENDSDSMSLVGSTIGIMIGSDWGLAVEGTYMKDTGSDFDMMQVATAVFF